MKYWQALISIIPTLINLNFNKDYNIAKLVKVRYGLRKLPAMMFFNLPLIMILTTHDDMLDDPTT